MLSYQSKDGQIDSKKTSSGLNPAFKLYMYILQYCHWIKMIKNLVRFYNELCINSIQVSISCLFY